MDKAVVIFTRRNFDPVCLLIRWLLPINRFALAKASHSMIVDGDDVIHATMLRGVIRQPMSQALRTRTIVARREYEVPNQQAGITWARKQIGKGYDFKAAFGLSFAPDRCWAAEDHWYCHELAAAYLHASGRKLFQQFGLVTDSALLLACTEVSRATDASGEFLFSRN